MSLSLEDQYNKIYTFCYFKVQNQQVAEDLTQETFLKFFASNNYLEKGKPLAYLYTIAKNNCNDYFRKGSTQEIIEDIMSEDIFENIDMIFTVKSEVAKLSKDKQELLLLRFSNELGIGEIAAYLGVSRFAVNRKLKSVLKELKSKLREEDFYG